MIEPDEVDVAEDLTQKELDLIYHEYQVYNAKGRHLMCICPLCRALELQRKEEPDNVVIRKAKV
jgi:hypothetical protein